MDIRSTLMLNNGVPIPRLGLGVYQTEPGDETYRAVRVALEVGYRHIDTARLYGNEVDVGRALRDSGLRREEVFVTTKLWNSDHGYEAAHRAFQASLNDLGLEYIDLYLIHWPVPRLRLDSWKALEELNEAGLARAVGVSNYMIRHLEEMWHAGTSTPTVNQVEFHPFLHLKDLRRFCREQEIALEAYSPLARGERFHHPVIQSAAREYGRSPAQILIRWALQHDLVVIPKSSDPKRILENAQVFDFEISGQDMAVLDSLNENFHTNWDPTSAP